MKLGSVRSLMVLGALFATGMVFLLPTTSRCGRRPFRLQCSSNLRQMGIGITVYTAIEDSFPPGTIPNDALSPDRRLGWGFAILPYLDMNGFFADRGITPAGVANLAADDPVFTELRKPPGIVRCPQSKTTYVAIAGMGVDAPSLRTSDPRAGVFGDSRRVTLADLKDGTSNTMMLVESSVASGLWFKGGPRSVQGLNPARQPYLGAGRQFGGIHLAGANVLLADGSVKFVADSVAPKVFEAASTIAGGEKVSGLVGD